MITSEAFASAILRAQSMVGYRQLLQESINLISNLPGIDDAILNAIRVAGLEQAEFPTKQSVHTFFDFIMYGSWQAKGLPAVVDFTFEQRAAIGNCIKAAANAILQTEVNALQSYIDATIPESEPEE